MTTPNKPRATHHFVRVTDAPGQPARSYPAISKTQALATARRIFATGFTGAVVEVYEGKIGDNVDRDPVKVFG